MIGEEGKFITLFCDFEHSPINFHITKWYTILGSITDEIGTCVNKTVGSNLLITWQTIIYN